jgi:hypothetical protein
MVTTRANRRTDFQAVLSYFDVELRVGVVVAPIPIGLLVPFLQPRKIVIFAMILLSPHAIGAIFMIVPIVVVFVSCIVVTPIILLFLPLIFAALALSQQHRGNC